ncbi:phage antirepressor Ant [Clostridium botulinum]|uniref:AntB n=1 Tax=Clostridium botulinum (strain Eklund 17B / Type B) TaxID=935198 RepID=B2TMD7_CLOBB|nr:AntB [Clostridium botulinum B str. Eklund 17B (NRP)]MBY6976792.1 ORF6C domain-containing protein [Clostridium botulinum]MBY7002285.1 ORF6C domain-containing protein [Clostridium botulinum]MCR1274112.1 ORF6C domain-containing protein [Clostridium botulinum]NFD68791.1 phage antirepressor Ant [Clostridium botulinum]
MELIKITEENGKQLVSGKELHQFLEVGRDFSTWIKERIKKYDFIENNDFTVLVTTPQNGGVAKDYIVTIEMAKELSMVENNSKGQAARKYFIQCEKNIKEIKQLSPMDQLRLQYSVLEEQDQKINLVDERVFKLENIMTIDYSQQEELRTLATRKVVAILGGKDTPAYKELNKKAFSSMWKDYKRIVDVNSYKNTAVKDLLFARQVIIDWKPNRELELMIKGANIGRRG